MASALGRVPFAFDLHRSLEAFVLSKVSLAIATSSVRAGRHNFLGEVMSWFVLLAPSGFREVLDAPSLLRASFLMAASSFNDFPPALLRMDGLSGKHGGS